jgi:hypothetical protein
MLKLPLKSSLSNVMLTKMTAYICLQAKIDHVKAEVRQKQADP